MAKWITNKEFSKLQRINVFGKEHSFKISSVSKYKNKHILFRKKSCLSDFSRACIVISADDYYKLYINGRFVCMGPASSYPSCYYYNEIDVSEFLNEGENTFAVHTYYSGLINRVFVSGDNMHGMFFKLYIDGKLYMSSDESWKTSYHSGYTDLGTYGYETGFLEKYDSSAKENGFEKADFDDSCWENAVINYELEKSCDFYGKADLLSVYDIRTKEIKREGNKIFIDIGRELCGYLTYKACGIRNSEITIFSGEELNEDGSVRYELRCNCRYVEKHVLSGGCDKYMQYDYKGFRYVCLLLPDGCSVDEDSIIITVRHHPYLEKADISSDNKKIENIFRLCADTVKYGVQESCVDCPTREKGQYLGDAGFIGMSHAVLTGDTKVLEKVLLDFAHSSFICPGLMAVSTCSFNQEIADYSLMYPFFAVWCYKKNNSIPFISELFPCIEGLMRYFDSFVKDGILCNVTEKWNLVDWPSNLRDGYDFDLQNPPLPGIHNVIAAYYIGAVESYEEIRQILGKPPIYDLKSLKKAFFSRFYDEKEGLFKDTPTSSHHSIHSNILPMLFDVEMTEKIKMRIIRMIREKKLLSVNYFAFFILLALEKEGEFGLMRELILDEGSWSNMLKEGATTCYEAWGKEQKWNTSLFHPWMSYPVIFYEKIK